MGIFDRFRRQRQDDSVLPAEVNQYYQSEQRERRGVALALGVITLIITLLVSTGLFFGGRYAYRKITNKDKPAVVQTNPGSSKQGASQQGDPSSGPSGNSPDSAEAPSPPQATTPTPSTGDEPPASSLPRTGDESL